MDTNPTSATPESRPAEPAAPAGGADSTASTPSPGPREPNFFERTWPKVKPYVDRGIVVGRVWMPFLSTPDIRARKIIFLAKDSRAEGVWSVALPKVCLQCGGDGGNFEKRFIQQVRNFESPGPIFGAIAGLFLFFILLSLWLVSSKLFLLATLVAVGGAVLMYVKSWGEEVDLVAWTCADHVDTATCPDLVPHEDTLHVMVTTPRLAEAGRADVMALRKARQGYAPSTSAPSASRPAPQPTIRPSDTSPAAPPQPEAAPYRRGELPPIKLDE